MKKLFTILFIIISSSVIGQPFQFNDSIFSENQFIVLYQIDFEFGKENLKTEQIQLDSLVNFLKKHDTLKFEIGVHTGFRGDEKYNLEISIDRANTLCNFLIENNIDRSRMTCIGYGENKSVIEFEDWEKIADTHRCGYYELGNRRITVVIK